ncbi:hypothetical protein M2266_003046 [Streptomyces sp. SPB162]|nr:hypothetical protein [Streptomyces sp. SPB162]
MLGAAGPAGQDVVLTRRAQGAGALRGLGRHRLDDLGDVREVPDPGRREGGEVLGEAHERHRHPVRPAVGGEFGGGGGEHGLAVGAGAGQRHDAGHRFEVEHQPGAVEGAEGRQARVRSAGGDVRVGRQIRPVQPPERLVLAELPRRGRLALRPGQLEVERLGGEPRRVDRRQLAAVRGEPRGQGAQRAVEERDGVGVRADAQRVGGVRLGTGGGPGRAHRARGDRLPQRGTAAPAQRCEQTGCQQRGGDERLGQAETVGLRRRRDGRRGRDLLTVGGPLNRQLRGGRSGIGVLRVRALGRRVLDAPALRVVLHVGRGLRRRDGHLHEVAAACVRRHLHDPAGPDQTRLGELRTVGLCPVLVELVDLVVAAAVAEVAFGYLPQGVVVPPLGRLDPVELRGRLAGLRGGRRARRHLRGGGPVGLLRARRVLLVLLHLPRRLLCGHGRTAAVRLVVQVAELREPRREAGGARTDQQQRGDQLARQQLARPGRGHPRRHPDPGDRGLRLHDHARRELRPRQPDHDRQHVDERVRRDRLPQHLHREVVRERRADDAKQRERHTHHQDGEREERRERPDDVPERTAAPGRLRPARLRRLGRSPAGGRACHGLVPLPSAFGGAGDGDLRGATCDVRRVRVRQPVAISAAAVPWTVKSLL